MNYHLAIDMGASSGRHILGRLEDGRLIIEEVHRFANGPQERGGRLVWDIDALLAEIKAGLKKCAAAGKKPASLGIDTWGVDYVLIDSGGREILPAHAYRDMRTEPFLNPAPGEAELYRRTGIQKQSFNTVFQLLADNAEGRLENAADMLFLPNYFSWKLCGVKGIEYTIASTSGLLDVRTGQWDMELVRQLGLPEAIFKPVVKCGTRLGMFTDAVKNEVGFDCEVIFPAAHDTGAAVAAVPRKDSMYISSGTWSLFGIEDKPNTSDKARTLNYTNEGGAAGTIRFMKNIMGLWVMQGLRKNLEDGGQKFTFQNLADMAEQEPAGEGIDINDQRFFAPKSMLAEIQGQCEKEGRPVPQTPAALARCVYDSLAKSYRVSAKEIEELSGRKFPHLCIVGGGSKDDLLNQLTADAIGRPVYAGPAEATAIGNIMIQCIAAGEVKDYEAAREIVSDSFAVKEFLPQRK